MSCDRKEVWCFKKIPYSRQDGVSPEHVALFGCISLGFSRPYSPQEDSRPIAQQPDIEVGINLYRTPEILFDGRTMIVTKNVEAELLAVADVKTRSVVTAGVYWVPYEPGTDAHCRFVGSDLAVGAGFEKATYDANMRPLVDLHLREVVALDDRFDDRPDDMAVVELDTGSEYPDYIRTVEVGISEHWLDHGLYRSGLFVCRGDVMRTLEPYLAYPYIRRYRLK